jgi:replicative DNA helicase
MRDFSKESIERAILGTIMILGRKAYSLTGLLREDFFQEGLNREVYKILETLRESGSPIDIHIVTAHSPKNDNDFHDYLIDLAEAHTLSSNLSEYCDLLRQFYASEKEGTILFQMAKRRRDRLNCDELADELKQLEQLKRSSDGLIPTVSDLSDDLMELYKDFEKLKPLDLGYLINGNAGEMIILGASTGMGKTAFALNMAIKAIQRNKCSVAFFALEMSKVQIMQRLWALLGRIPLGKLKLADRLNNEDWQKIRLANKKLSTLPLRVDDKSFQTIDSISNELRKLKQKDNNLKLVFVDYLQLITSRNQKENRNIEVGAISRNLKLIAKDLDIVLVALSQVNRNFAQKADKVPTLSDLRDSGSIEQDADQVLFLHRPEHLEKTGMNQGLAELHIAKNRQGQSGFKLDMSFEGSYCRFSMLDELDDIGLLADSIDNELDDMNSALFN